MNGKPVLLYVDVKTVLNEALSGAMYKRIKTIPTVENVCNSAAQLFNQPCWSIRNPFCMAHIKVIPIPIATCTFKDSGLAPYAINAPFTSEAKPDEKAAFP